MIRGRPPYVDERSGINLGGGWNNHNVGKLSVTINLKHARGKALKEVGEDTFFRSEMEQHLQAFVNKKPRRETYRPQDANREPIRSKAEETVFLGSILQLRAAKGFRRKGIVLHAGAQYVMEILVQK